MKSKIFLLLYGGWVIWWLSFTCLEIGDAGVPAHLWLIITGLPLSLASWFLPHGALSSVLAAGVLGGIQWFILIFVFGRNWKRNSSIGANVK